MRTTFRDPLGRTAVFGDLPAGSAAIYDGRRAVFSGPKRRRGFVIVECSRCHTRTPLALAALALHFLPSLWVPGRTFSRLMRCATCRHLAWCRIRWREAWDL